MAKYNLIARRHIGEDWSAWSNTDDAKTLADNIKTIEEYGWLWSLETPMNTTQFKCACYTRGINRKLVDAYCKGRIKFVSDDIDILQQGRWKI